jgi:hypothetical protein
VNVEKFIDNGIPGKCSTGAEYPLWKTGILEKR